MSRKQFVLTVASAVVLGFSPSKLAAQVTPDSSTLCLDPDQANPPPAGEAESCIASAADIGEEITVIARAQADATIYSEAETRSVRSYNDLLKPIAGVAANDFDQGGVGFGLTLRGFTERSNGGNVALFVDDVPVNQPGHRTTNGYGDLSALLPELIGSLVLIRGPFDVRAGPFNLAGSARFETRDDPSSGALFKGGSHEFAKGFAVKTFASGAVRGYGSAMLSTTDGYRNNSDWRQLNSVNKLFFPLLRGTGTLQLQGYESEFDSPGYVSRDLIRSGAISARTARNTTDGGKTSLGKLVFNYREDGESPWRGNLYVISSDHRRYSSRGNSIPVDPNTPGVQFLTTDDRITFGGTIERRWRTTMGGMALDLLTGLGGRWDDVRSDEYQTIARRIVGSRSAVGTLVDFTVADRFAYGEASLSPVRWLTLSGGLRYDGMSYDVVDRSRPPHTRISPDVNVWHPTAGIKLTPLSGLDLFANYGEGYRPPSPIGNSQLLLNPNFPAAKLEAEEVGILYQSPNGRWRGRAAYYHSRFSDQVLGQPPPLTPIELGPSVRQGFDIEAQAVAVRSAAHELALYASYSTVDGKLTDPPAGQGRFLPEVADFFVKYGLDALLRRGGGSWTLSLGQVWEGPKLLNSTGTFRTKTFSRVDASVHYTNERWGGIALFADAIIYPDRRLEETAFLFAGQVGVSAKPPVTVTVGAFLPF